MDELSADQLKERGDKNSSVGNYKIAIKDYTNAIKKNPKFGRAYNNRGNAYLLSEQYYSCIGDFTRSISLAPNNAYAYLWRANAYMQLGQYLDCINDCSIVISLEPENAKAYFWRGVAKSATGSNACNDNKKACELGITKACEWYIEDNCE